MFTLEESFMFNSSSPVLRTDFICAFKNKTSTWQKFVQLLNIRTMWSSGAFVPSLQAMALTTSCKSANVGKILLGQLDFISDESHSL